MVYFLTPAVVPAPLATPSAPLGDSVSSAPVTARPTHGGDALEDHGGLPLSPPADRSIVRLLAELIQVSGDSFQHTDHPRTVEANKLCLDICIESKIHNHVFAALQSLQPVNTASQRLNFSRQAGSDLGFQLRPFRFVLWSGTSPRLSQLAQPDWDPLGFWRAQKLVDST